MLTSGRIVVQVFSSSHSCLKQLFCFIGCQFSFVTGGPGQENIRISVVLSTKTVAGLIFLVSTGLVLALLNQSKRFFPKTYSVELFFFSLFSWLIWSRNTYNLQPFKRENLVCIYLSNVVKLNITPRLLFYQAFHVKFYFFWPVTCSLFWYSSFCYARHCSIVFCSRPK